MAYYLDDIPDFDSTPSYSPRKINSDDSYWEQSDDEKTQKTNFQEKEKSNHKGRPPGAKFSIYQVQEMEKEFQLELDDNCKTKKIPELAKRLDLSERQVLRWFDNRRQRWKKMNIEKAQSSSAADTGTVKTTVSAEKKTLSTQPLNEILMINSHQKWLSLHDKIPDTDKHIPWQILNKIDGKICIVCRHEGKVRSHTYRHILGVHLKLKVYQCNMCDFGNEKIGLLREHFQTNHKDGNLNENILPISQEDKHIPLDILNKLDGTVCKVCRYDGHKKYSTMKHIRDSHLNTKLFQCDHCDFGDEILQALELHYNSKHKDVHTAKVSKLETAEQNDEKSSTDDSEFSDKENSNEPNVTNVTESQSENSKSDQKGINEQNESEEKKKYYCGKCSFWTYKNSHLKDYHFKTLEYKSNKKYSCDQCNFTSCTKFGLTKHNKKGIHESASNNSNQESNPIEEESNYVSKNVKNKLEKSVSKSSSESEFEDTSDEEESDNTPMIKTNAEKSSTDDDDSAEFSDENEVHENNVNFTENIQESNENDSNVNNDDSTEFSDENEIHENFNNQSFQSDTSEIKDTSDEEETDDDTSISRKMISDAEPKPVTKYKPRPKSKQKTSPLLPAPIIDGPFTKEIEENEDKLSSFHEKNSPTNSEEDKKELIKNLVEKVQLVVCKSAPTNDYLKNDEEILGKTPPKKYKPGPKSKRKSFFHEKVISTPPPKESSNENMEKTNENVKDDDILEENNVNLTENIPENNENDSSQFEATNDSDDLDLSKTDNLENIAENHDDKNDIELDNLSKEEIPNNDNNDFTSKEDDNSTDSNNLDFSETNMEKNVVVGSENVDPNQCSKCNARISRRDSTIHKCSIDQSDINSVNDSSNPLKKICFKCQNMILLSKHASHERFCGIGTTSNEKEQRCQTCNYNFPKFVEKEFIKHSMRCQMWNKFVKDDNVTCKLCDQKFDHNGFLLVHLNDQICVRRKKQICEHCNQEFTHNKQFSDEDFNRHVEKCSKYNKDIIDLKTCKFCEKSFSSYGIVLSHVEKQSCRSERFQKSKEMICPSCDQDFTNDRNVFYKPELFTSHVARCEKYHKNVIDFQICGFCLKEFSTHNQALMHIERQICRNAKEKTELICPTCSKDFSGSSRYFESHLEKCEKWNQYLKDSTTCQFCDHFFSTHQFALRHIPVCPNLPNNLKYEANSTLIETGKHYFKTCNYCLKEITKNGYMIHKQYCQDNPNRLTQECPKSFQSCSKCSKVLLSGIGLAAHERSCGIYPDKPKQFCETCKQEYPNYREDYGEFSRHVEKCQKWYEIGVDQKDHKTCKLCQHEFDSIGYLLVHLDKQYCTKEKSEQICPNCSCNYSKLRSVDFVKHKERCEKYYKDVVDGNTCGLCNKKFDSMGYLFVHLENERCSEENTNRTCSSCSESFPKRNLVEFKKHQEKCKKLYKNVLENNQCKLCKSYFNSVSGVLSHLENRVCTEKSGPNCRLCLQYFLNKSEYNEHLITCKQKNPAKLKELECRFCGKICKSKANAVAHMKEQVCVGKPEKICEICSRDLGKVKPSEFDIHVQKCSKFQKYIKEDCVCKLCNRKFEKRPGANLFTHLEKKHIHRITKDEPSSECKYCQLLFPLDKIEAHEKKCKNLIHLIRYTDCVLCKKSFKTLKQVYHHIEEAHPSMIGQKIDFAFESTNDNEVKDIEVESTNEEQDFRFESTNRIEYQSSMIEHSDARLENPVAFNKNEDNANTKMSDNSSSKRKPRTIFSVEQLQELEKSFESNNQWFGPELPQKIGLDYQTVNTWFINRRFKWKNTNSQMPLPSKPPKDNENGMSTSEPADSGLSHRLKWGESGVTLDPKTNQYNCNVCSFAFKTRYDGLKHVSKEHGAQVQFPCDYCDMKFFTKNSLKVHMTDSAAKKLHTCQICDFKSCNLNGLNKHKTEEKHVDNTTTTDKIENEKSSRRIEDSEKTEQLSKKISEQGKINWQIFENVAKNVTGAKRQRSSSRSDESQNQTPPTEKKLKLIQLKNTIENQEKYSQEIIKRERTSSISEIIPVAKKQKIEDVPCVDLTNDEESEIIQKCGGENLVENVLNPNNFSFEHQNGGGEVKNEQVTKKVSEENIVDEMQNLTEEELLTKVEKVIMEDDTKLDLPNLVYIHAGSEKRLPMTKSDFDKFHDFLEDKIVNLEDQDMEIVIDWHGYGLQRGIIGCRDATTANFVKETASNFIVRGNQKFRGWLKNEFGAKKDRFTGYLNGKLWLRKESEEALNWIFNKNKIEGAKFHVIEYIKGAEGVQVTFETQGNTTNAIKGKSNVLKAGLTLLKLTLL